MFAPESETEIHRKVRVLKGREHIHSMVLKLMVLLCEINEHVQLKPFESCFGKPILPFYIYFYHNMPIAWITYRRKYIQESTEIQFYEFPLLLIFYYKQFQKFYIFLFCV